MSDEPRDREGAPPPAAPTEVPKWREDFPIGWQADDYVSRRELTKFLTLGSGLLATANVGLVVLGRTRRTPPTPRMKIGRVAEIAPSASLLFRYPTERDPCILIRDRDGHFAAFSQVCTHLSCAVVHRPDEDALFCPCHHGYFSAREGRPTGGPPTRPLPRILLEEVDGELFAVGVQV